MTDRALKPTWHVIGRGLAGWHAAGVNVTSSGGDLEPREWWAGGMTTGYLSEAVDGCLIYDAEDADPSIFRAFIISGPMVNPELAPDADDRFTDADRSTAARMLVPGGLQGAYATLATMAQSPKYGGLDRVGVGIYRRLLKTIPGIKIGTVHGGVITWDA